MALINFYDNPIKENAVSRTYESGLKLKDILDKYIEENIKETQTVETYDIETGETIFEEVENEGYKALVIVNGQENNLEYIVQTDDVISIVIIPESKSGMQAWGSFLVGAGTLVSYIPVYGQVIGGIMVGVGLAMTLIASQMSDGSNNGTNQDALEHEAALKIGGNNNQDMKDKRFPFILGKHLVNPGIIGSPYNTTYTTDFEKGEDGGQYVTQLYVVGYAPLKLTDFRLGETKLAYNRTSDAGYKSPVMHGMLRGIGSEGTDEGDILRKWKNNDVSIEILQAGDFASNDNDRYGQLYNQTVEQIAPNANILRIEDGLIKSVAEERQIYRGVSVPDGYMTNTVRFSRACPQRLEVELDFPQGLYAQRTYSSDKGSKVCYYNLPVRLAVQWRYVTNSMTSSDPLSPTDVTNPWHDFDYIEIGSKEEGVTKKIEPSLYTISKKVYDYNSSFGRAEDYYDPYDPAKVEDFVTNDNWLNNGKLFEFGVQDQPEFDDKLEQQLYEYQVSRFDVKDGNLITLGTEWVQGKGTIFENDVYYNNLKEGFASGRIQRLPKVQMYKVSPFEKGWFLDYSNMEAFDAGDEYSVPGYITDIRLGGKRGTKHSKSILTKPGKQGYGPKDFESVSGVNERRYVVVKEFTDEECQRFINYNNEEKVVDNCVEVRVLRINPCYLAEEGDRSSKDKYSNMSYQDLCKWTYMRTWAFDKDKYKEALDEAKKEGRDLSEISVKDFPLRPLSQKDMDKFALVAINIKQDINQTAGSSLSSMSLIASSLAPKYNSEEEKWVPEKINKTFGYFRKYTDDKKTNIVEYASKEEWEADKEVYPDDLFIETDKGNDFVKQIKEDIFNSESSSSTVDQEALEAELDLFKEYGLYKAGFDLNIYTGDITDIDGVLIEKGKTMPHKLGNVDMDNRTVIHWVHDTTQHFDDGIAVSIEEQGQWLTDWMGVEKEDIVDGQYSTVGSQGITYDDMNIAYTPLGHDGSMYTVDGVKQYLDSIVGKSGNDKEVLLENDKEGMDINGVHISNIIIGIEDTIEKCELLGGIAHFTGKYGSISLLYKYETSGSRYILTDDIDEKYVTANPASMGLLALVGGHLGEDAKTYECVNLETAAECYEQWEDMTDGTRVDENSDELLHMQWTCNGVISAEVKLETLLQKILATGRASLRRDEDNRLEFFMGKAEYYPQTVLDSQNVLGVSNTRSFEEAPSGFHCQFIDESDNYGQNDIYIMNDGENYKNPTKETRDFSIAYVTNRNQLYSLAKFNLMTTIYQRELYSRTVGKLGYTLSFGDVVLLQDPSLVVGTDNGGRIMEIIEDDRFIYGFTTSEPFEYRNDRNPDGTWLKQGCTIVQPSKFKQSRCVTLTFAEPGSPNSVRKLVPKNKVINVHTETTSYPNGYLTHDITPVSDKVEHIDTIIPYKGGYKIEGLNEEGEFTKELTYEMKLGRTNVCLLAYPVRKFDNTSREFDEYDGDDDEEYDVITIEPKMDNIVAFGNVVSNTIKAQIVAIKPKDNEQFELSLVPYNEDLYNMGTTIPQFDSHMTPEITDDIPFSDSVTPQQLNEFTSNNTTQITETFTDSIAYVNEKVDSITGTVTVYTDISSIGIAVNDNDIVTADQEFDINFYARQGEEDLDFYFAVDSFALPAQWDYKLDHHTLHITVPEGTLVTTENLRFPIMFTAYKYNFEYADADGYGYTDQGGEDVYGAREQAEFETKYEIGVTAIGVQGGRYHGSITDVTDKDGADILVNSDGKEIAVDSLILGDYFTFVGAKDEKGEYIGIDKQSELVEYGTFHCSYLYEYAGVSKSRDWLFKEDSMSEHCGGSLSDALSVANLSIEHNNSHVTQFLDHLTANSIFVDKLVANDAFIDNLFAHQIQLQNKVDAEGETHYGAIYGGNRYLADGSLNPDASDDDKGVHISANGLLQADKAVLNDADVNGSISCEKLNIVNTKTSDFNYCLSGFAGKAKTTITADEVGKGKRYGYVAYRRQIIAKTKVCLKFYPGSGSTLVKTFNDFNVTSAVIKILNPQMREITRFPLQVRYDSTNKVFWFLFDEGSDKIVDIDYGSIVELNLRFEFTSNSDYAVVNAFEFREYGGSGIFISGENTLLSFLTKISLDDDVKIKNY